MQEGDGAELGVGTGPGTGALEGAADGAQQDAEHEWLFRGLGLEVPLSFLPAGRRYVAEIYADNERSHWLTAPLECQILEQPVDSSTKVTLRMAAGGGVAVRIRPAS